jgi:signal transduction histidine kinase
MIKIYVLFAIILSIVYILYLIYGKWYASRNKSLRSFLILCLGALFWCFGIITIFTSNYQDFLYDLGFLMFMVGPVVSAHFIYEFSYFSYVYTNEVRRNQSVLLIMRVVYITAVLYSAHLTFLNNISIASTAAQNPLNNIGIKSTLSYAVYASFFVISFTASYINIYLYGYKRETYPIKKRRALISLLAVLITSFLAMVTNLSIPVFTQSLNTIWMGPVFTLIFIYLITYGVVKYSLFDIKTSAFRAVGYTIAMGVSILAITMFVLWGILAPLTSDWTKYPNETYAVTFFSILIIGWLSPKFINMFNRVTYPIFYRNNYNPILFAEHMAEAVTGNPQTTDLQRSILKLFNKAYGAGYIQVIVNQIEDDDPHQSNLVIGESLGHGAPDEVLGFYGRLFFGYEQKHKYILRSKLDFEEGSEENKQLDENNIGMIAKLKLNKRLVGYIVFGEKTSGTLYTPEDVNLVKNHHSEIAVALQNSVRYNRIKQFNLELQEKVDIATAKLKKSNARLRKLDKAKDDFLSIASHQLRTPLTVVRGNISLVAEGTMGKVSPQAHDILVQSERSAGRLADLINDFLSTSRLKTGKFILDPAPMDLGDAVEEEYERLKDFASMRGVDLVMHKIPVDLPLIMADASKIRQVLLNTIDNAIYYSPRRSGKVEIMVYSDGKSVIYKVKDNGIGVPAREKHKMFTRMYRAENAKGVRPDGNGLGLFLMKKIIDAHNGTIIFESKEGVGSTFGFKIDINPKVPLERAVIT